MGDENIWTQCVGCHNTIYYKDKKNIPKFCKDCEKDNENLSKRGPFTLVDVMKIVEKK
jgi:acetyl-CoA carboxylase beta subunit